MTARPVFIPPMTFRDVFAHFAFVTGESYAHPRLGHAPTAEFCKRLADLAQNAPDDVTAFGRVHAEITAANEASALPATVTAETGGKR